ncbi:helix-turn-helix domain-containing protein [uncultured Chryseobacterium sp.]|uniref:helix-turn-helix domain-containing protein n=1 Tax=uncultured Chryseobacterium sp. TaxID=259322 RepID=UPI003442F878
MHGVYRLPRPAKRKNSSSLIGQNARQYIRSKLIEKAREKLIGTDLTVAEIAYEPGFEHPQSFSKMFRLRTGLSPLEFRGSFE